MHCASQPPCKRRSELGSSGRPVPPLAGWLIAHSFVTPHRGRNELGGMAADAINGNSDKIAASAKEQAKAQYAALRSGVVKLGRSEVDKVMGEKQSEATAALAQLLASALSGGGGGGVLDGLMQVPEYKVVIDVATVKCTQETLGQKSALPQSVIPFVALVKVRRSWQAGAPLAAVRSARVHARRAAS